MNRPEYGFKDTLNSMLLTFVQTLHVLQPVKYPGFAFAWLQLVSSKFVIAPLLKNVVIFGLNKIGQQRILDSVQHSDCGSDDFLQGGVHFWFAQQPRDEIILQRHPKVN